MPLKIKAVPNNIVCLIFDPYQDLAGSLEKKLLSEVPPSPEWPGNHHPKSERNLYIFLYIQIYNIHVYQLKLNQLKLTQLSFLITVPYIMHNLPSSTDLRIITARGSRWSSLIIGDLAPPSNFQRHPKHQCTLPLSPTIATCWRENGTASCGISTKWQKLSLRMAFTVCQPCWMKGVQNASRRSSKGVQNVFKSCAKMCKRGSTWFNLRSKPFSNPQWKFPLRDSTRY